MLKSIVTYAKQADVGIEDMSFEIKYEEISVYDSMPGNLPEGMVMGVIEMDFRLYFLGKILKKKIWPPFYFLFAVCAVIVSDVVPASTITGFAALVFLLSACGVFVCRADVKSSILYAALSVV